MTEAAGARISLDLIERSGAIGIDTHAFAWQVLSSVPSGVIAVDTRGRLVLVNAAAGRMLGLHDVERLVGRPCRTALASYPDLARLLLETFDTRTPPNRAELELRHASDEGRTIGYTLTLVRDEAARVIGVAMFFKDLTRIERLEEQARLKDRLAVLGQMAAGLAHEMRNPLAAIEIHAGLLRRAVEPSLAAYTESIDHILMEARRLNEWVATCLDIVRPVEIVARPVPIEPLLDAVATQPGAAAAHVERQYAEGGTVALGDPLQLRRVFDNLVSNAREAAGPSGRVWLRTRLTRHPPLADDEDGGEEFGGAAHHDEVVIEVADDGPGIPEAYRDKVFQPYFTTKPRGSGLGLAMVQKIVQSHRGRIDFTDRAGRGTVFRVILPAAPVDRP